MTVGTILGLCAIGAAFFFLYLVRERREQVHDVKDLVAKSRPVDLKAFRNLVSREEEQFLRSNLPRSDFRAVHRARMKAAIDYVRRSSYNARLLLQVARMARNAPLPEAAGAAQRLADDALQMRIFSMLAICFIYARIAAPDLKLRPVTIVERYEGLRESTSRLLRIHLPNSVSQVETAL